MINIADDVRTEFLKDSTSKMLTIESEGTNSYMNHSMLLPYTNETGMFANRTFQNNDTLPPARPGSSYGIFPKDYTMSSLSTLNFLDEDYSTGDDVDITKFDYLCIAFSISVSPDTEPSEYPLPSTFFLSITAKASGITTRYTETKYFNREDYAASILGESPDFQQVKFIVPTSYFSSTVENILWIDFGIPDTETVSFIGSVWVNYVGIYVGNDPDNLPLPYKRYSSTDVDVRLDNILIDNDHLLSESFSLNESLCSEPNIKFGLCEAAYCQFTVADDYHDFREREIRPSISVTTDAVYHKALKKINLYAWGTSPGGSEHKYWPYPGSQVSMSLRNMALSNAQYWNNDACCQISPSAKNFLKYFKFIRISLDVEFHFDSGYTPEIMPAKVLFGTSAEVEYPDGTIATNQWTMVSVNGVHTEFGGCNKIYKFSDFVNTYKTITVYVPIDYDDYFAQYAPTIWYKHGKLSDLGFNYNRSTVRYKFLKEDNTAYTAEDGTISMNGGIQNVQVSFVDSMDEPVPTYNKYDAIEFYGTSIDDYLEQQNTSIPLGVFTVDSIKKNYVNDILKQEITAYDKLTLLEQNAADWYTQYMFGVTTDEDAERRYGFEYVRQVFSTYYNYTKSIGLEDDSFYTDTEIFGAHYDYDTPEEMRLTWASVNTAQEYYPGGYISYAKIPINDSDVNPTKLYKIGVNIRPLSYIKESGDIPESYLRNVDSLARGFCTANILVQETLSNGHTNKFCVDANDYFMISSNCTSLDIYIAYKYLYGQTNITLLGTETEIGSWVSVYRADSAPDLPNGHTRLLYYNYDTKEIFDCDSSITGRDVVRSLLEINGCFYRLNRSTGKPEFVYCNKSGLYPSISLYPRNVLYPRMGPNEVITRDQYQSFIQEDYTVQKFGKIQILKNITSNQTKSVVEWEYTGDDKYINSYLIEDNIFYCNKDMLYDYDNMPEVSEMLQNMWSRISNMDYTPCVLVSKGMPWVECGDRVLALTKYGGAESFVFHRTLKGIQSLTDTFESEGDEYNKEVKDYGYKIWEG